MPLNVHKSQIVTLKELLGIAYLMKSNKLGIKYKIAVWFVIILCLVSLAIIIIRAELLFAKNLQFKGVVQNITWVSRNHQLPEFLILEHSGKKITVSHFSIGLNKSDIKIGDVVTKTKGDDYIIINGEKIKLSQF